MLWRKRRESGRAVRRGEVEVETPGVERWGRSWAQQAGGGPRVQDLGGGHPGKEQPASVRLSRALSWRLALLTCDHGSRPATERGARQLPVLIRRVWNSCNAVSWDGQALGAGNHLPACRHGALGPVRGSSVPRSAAGDPVNGVEHLSVASLPWVRGISECLPAQEGPRHAGPSTVRSRLVWVRGVTVESWLWGPPASLKSTANPVVTVGAGSCAHTQQCVRQAGCPRPCSLAWLTSWEWLLSAQAAFSAAPSMGRWIEQETGSEVTRVFLSPAVGS